MIILGFGLMVIPFFAGNPGFIAWIYGVPIIILGFFVLLNKKEDEIEKIKSGR